MASLSELTLRDALTASTPSTYYTEGNWRKPTWAGAEVHPTASGADFSSFGTLSSTYWNANSFTRGACTIEYTSGSQANERYCALYVCLSTEHNGYRVEVLNTTESGESKWKMILQKYTSGTPTTLAESAVIEGEPLAGQFLGLWNNGGVIEGWRKTTGGVWTRVVQAADATYTTGFTGFEGSGSNPVFKNFSAGELATTTFGSLMPVVV